MNPHKPIVLVIASVLKPVDDVRMYKKFAKSLVRTDKYAVNVVGFQAPVPSDPSVRFYPLFNFSRVHWRRLTATYTFYRILRKIAPEVLILTTPELYPAAWWYHKCYGGCLVYDIVENYGRNIRYNQGFAPWAIRPLFRTLAFVEHRLRSASSLLLSAEKGYIDELALAPSTVTVVENKALRPTHFPNKERNPTNPLSIIYTGTVSEVYGINQALAVVQSLLEREKLSITLTILGHVPQAALHDQLHEYAGQHPWVVLQTQNRPVSHDAIISLIQRADVGIVSHQPVPSIARCFPTRIWEYMAYRLPFLLQDHPYWTDYCAPWQCAIPVDFNQPSTPAIKQKLLAGSFYSRGVPDTIYWETEEKKLLGALDRLIDRY